MMAGAVWAKPAMPPLSATKHDNRAPIEVTSDTLEVFQQENRAVFTGHVVAIQKDVRLKADTMTVYYRAQEKDAKAPKKTAAPEANAIKRIEATGNVFLSTPEETASGAKGVYDVEHHEIHLTDNVVLTRGKNVLKGEAVTYNFDTGRSIMQSQAVGTPSKDGSGRQRVRALFVPENKKE